MALWREQQKIGFPILRPAMEYLNKIRSSVAAQVHSVAAQVNLALPGNPIFREFQVREQIGSAGPGLCWKIYAGTKNSTKQEVAVWLFEKKQTENWLKVKREELPEMLKRGVSQLTRLRHPRILTVERALEESRDCFSFCTEPLFASLANCFGDLDNITPPPRQLKDFELEDVEIRHGLFQISEALAFLHNDIKTVHCNISPSSILINSKGAWKLGGFDFCIVGNTETPGKTTFELPAWSRDSISALCPDLDFVAPELADGTKCDSQVDIFSLGVLAFATFNRGKPLFNSQNSFACYSKHFEQLDQQRLGQLLAVVPADLRQDVKMCLNQTPELRPDAIQFTKLAYFEHPLVKTLNFLDSRTAMDHSQKMQFFKGLPAILPQFPKRVQLQKLYAHLAAEFGQPMLVPFILSSVFLIAEGATAEEFGTVIMPSLVTVFPVQTPYQIGLLLLQRVGLFLEKMPAAAIKQHLLPLIYNSLSSESVKIQELCLSEVPNVVRYIDREQMRTQLLPKLLRMVLESREVNIRVQTMVCMAKLLPHMEPWMVADQILPSLAKVSSKDPGVLMAVLGIYKMVFECEKFGINKDQCAKGILPFLISTSVESTLNLQQFEQFIALVHKLLEKVETEQRKALRQMTASQVEQRKITDFADFLNNQASAGTTTNGGFQQQQQQQADVVDLGDVSFMLGGASTDQTLAKPAGGTSAQNPVNNGNKIGLTLDEKKRIIAEKEEQIHRATGQHRTDQSPDMANLQPQTTNALRFDLFATQSGPSPSLHQQPMRPPISLSQTVSPGLEEFMPELLGTARAPRPSSTTPASSTQHPMAQCSSFASFPSIPLPNNNSANPIQRRAVGGQGLTMAGTSDPFDSLLMDIQRQTPMEAKKEIANFTADLLGQLNQTQKKMTESKKEKDPFEDLMG